MSSLIMTVILAAAVPAGGSNLAPVAVGDEVLVMGATEYIKIPVFANDWDPDGDPLEVTAILSVDRGKAVLLKGGAARSASRPTGLPTSAVTPMDRS